MATNFPGSLDSYATLVDNTDNIVAAHPNDRGDAIEAIEAKVGADSSAVATSHDYLLTHLTSQQSSNASCIVGQSSPSPTVNS